MRTWNSSHRIGAALLWIAAIASPAIAQDTSHRPKLDPLARLESTRGSGWSRIIVRAANRPALQALRPLLAQAGGTSGRDLPIINGRTALVPNAALAGLARNPFVDGIAIDRPVGAAMERTATTIRADFVRQQFGYDGSGVGVAIVDSGVASWHDDLTGPGGQRVAEFVDVVNGNPSPYDDHGHGTHVAGIVAGNGYDSGGARTGVAPGAHLLVLKALDSSGVGRVSDVIAALDHILTRKDALNIRVVNLSISASVYERYDADPLTLAAKRLVEAGVVVVAAAGNSGRDAEGRTLYGGVTSPGNAPWVLTVGASSHLGTSDRGDDAAAAFSARGPAAISFNAKPDILAPGVGIESLSDPGSALYTSRPTYLLGGTVPTSYQPYLTLSGTSMSAPVVAGTVALMVQANPALTPNAVKAILQYSAEPYAGYDALTQGAGFLNARGAVELSRYFAAPLAMSYPSTSGWAAQLIWGNQRLRNGRLTPDANAWAADVTWGAGRTPSGENVRWGVAQDELRDPWSAKCYDADCQFAQWGFGKPQNVVWGWTCGGFDCSTSWSAQRTGVVTDPTAATIVGGSTVVWGSTEGEGDTVVWGSTEGEGDTVVWGSGCRDPLCDIRWNPDIK